MSPLSPKPQHPHHDASLLHQQMWLLYLRHSSKCTHEEECPDQLQDCGKMKVIWQHVVSCSNERCQVGAAVLRWDFPHTSILPGVLEIGRRGEKTGEADGSGEDLQK